jgi:AcrR family transcriptional regulator
MTETLRPMRADARRNRERILEVAFATFAAEGLSVPVQEIARRAGVGTGTVSRHFPTKESLFEAVVLNRAAGLAEEAARLARADDPGAAFFEYFALLIAEGAKNLGMAEALMGAGYDLDEVCLRDGIDLKGALNGLLAGAQRAGAVRPDVNADDVKALMTSCLSRTPTSADPAARDRMVEIATAGLRRTSLPDALDVREEPADHRRVAQHVHPDAGQVRGDRYAEPRQAAPPVRPDPVPVLGPLTTAAQGPPRAAQEAEVKDDDRVRGGQPRRQAGVVRAEVAVDDPPLAGDQFPVPGHPHLRRGGRRPRLPEQPVEFDRGDTGQFTELTGEHGLARAAPSKDDHSPHSPIVPG